MPLLCPLTDGKPRVRGASRPHVYSVAERAFRFMTEPKEALLLGKQVGVTLVSERVLMMVNILCIM